MPVDFSVPVDRPEDGEVAPAELLMATVRDEGVATPEGTEVVTGAGIAVVRLGRNSDQSINRDSNALLEDHHVLFFRFF